MKDLIEGWESFIDPDPFTRFYFDRITTVLYIAAYKTDHNLNQIRAERKAIDGRIRLTLFSRRDGSFLYSVEWR